MLDQALSLHGALAVHAADHCFIIIPEHWDFTHRTDIGQAIFIRLILPGCWSHNLRDHVSGPLHDYALRAAAVCGVDTTSEAETDNEEAGFPLSQREQEIVAALAERGAWDQVKGTSIWRQLERRQLCRGPSSRSPALLSSSRRRSGGSRRPARPCPPRSGAGATVGKLLPKLGLHYPLILISAQ